MQGGIRRGAEPPLAVQPTHPRRVAGAGCLLLLPRAREVRGARGGSRVAALAASRRRASVRRDWPGDDPEPLDAQLPALQHVRSGREAAEQGAAAREPEQPAAVQVPLLPGPHPRDPAGVLRREGVPDPGAPQGSQARERVRPGAHQVDHRRTATARGDSGEEGSHNRRLRRRRRAEGAPPLPRAHRRGQARRPREVPRRAGGPRGCVQGG